jgi:hypothetical protein
MFTENCHYCTNPLPQKPFIAVKEVNIAREGIEMDVEAEYKFCSGKCKKEWLDSSDNWQSRLGTSH